MKIWVEVEAVSKNLIGGVVVEASNGNHGGPPFLRFLLPREMRVPTIGDRYEVEIKDVKQ